MLGRARLRSSSSTQTVPALSFGESEFYSTVRGASVGLGMVSLSADYGVALKLKLWIGSSASIGVASRRGAGKTRHIATPTLWLQHHVTSGAIVVAKISGVLNGADRAPNTWRDIRLRSSWVELVCTELVVGRAHKAFLE